MGSWINLGSKKILGQKTNSVWKMYWARKKFWDFFFFISKQFGWEKSLGPIKPWVQKSFWTKKILGPKNILVQKILSPKKILGLKNILARKDFGAKIFWWKKFWSKIILGLKRILVCEEFFVWKNLCPKIISGTQV